MTEPQKAPPAEMPKELVQFLIGGQTCVVASVDTGGRPITSIMTWVVARDTRTIAIAVDSRSRALANVRANGQLALEVLGDDLCYSVRGVAVIEKERVESAPFPSALVTVRIEECRNQAVQGVKFFGPRYHFHEGKEHRTEVEKRVFAELKGPAPTI
jgi:flavin reductase (DIM6/NTAB) family NADH-FMN oxidoreductase RutF